MQLATVPPPLAPLATGHPLSLPEIRRARTTQTRVDPVAETGRTATWDSALPGRDPQLGAYLHGPDDARIPPPSLMQLRISEILAQQLSGLETSDPENGTYTHADIKPNSDTKQIPDKHIPIGIVITGVITNNSGAAMTSDKQPALAGLPSQHLAPGYLTTQQMPAQPLGIVATSQDSHANIAL